MSSNHTSAEPALVVTGGPQDGQRLVLEGPMVEKTLGSGANTHLRLPSAGIDAIHGRLSWEDRGIVLTDEGSMAGVYVNGERVIGNQVLADGDSVSLGPPGGDESVTLLFTAPPGFTAAAEEAPLVLSLDDEPPPTDPEPLVLDPVTPTAPSAPPPAPAPPPAARAAPPAIIFNERAAPARREQHSTDGDVSIVTDRVREPLAVPALSPPPPKKPAARPAAPAARAAGGGLPVTRLVLVGLGAVVVGAGAIFAYSRLHRAPPVLHATSPAKVEPGQTLTLKGSGFDASADAQTVTFGEAAGTVTAATESDLVVTVPAGLAPDGPADVAVVVRRGDDASNALFVKVVRYPKATRLEPDVAVPGADVVIHGQNLRSTALAVRVGGIRAEVKEAQPAAARITVPEMPFREGLPVQVTVEVGSEAARPLTLLLGRLPLITGLSPSSGPAGLRLAIQGRGFDADPAKNRVTVGGEPALVLSASAQELQVAVPAPRGGPMAPPGPRPVRVEAGGAASAGEPTFNFQRASAGVYRPQFFAAPVPDGPAGGHAFVSTEIGPFLLLTGKADAPSVAERAARAADALSAAMEAASRGPVTVEVREGPAPAVALAGGPVLLTATGDDADGYAQGRGGKAGTRPSPRALAAYWSALVQDYLTLFGRGGRPTRVLEVAAGSRALLDLHAAAERRGMAGGVPMGAVSTLAPATAQAIRDMAHTVPAPGAAAVGAAVAGRWEGTLEEAGGARAIAIDLHVQGSRLAGSLVTKTGAIAVQIPLQRVSYDKGLLKFTAAVGGAPREFQGRLDGSTLAGDVYKSAAGRQPVGRFNLKYVQ